MKQKLLKPSLREKKKYLVYEVISDNTIEYKLLKDIILNTFKEYFGNFILSKANIKFIEYKDNIGIIKINNKYLDHLKASFCLIRKINKSDLMIRSLGISGMINKARDKFIRKN